MNPHIGLPPNPITHTAVLFVPVPVLVFETLVTSVGSCCYLSPALLRSGTRLMFMVLGVPYYTTV